MMADGQLCYSSGQLFHFRLVGECWRVTATEPVAARFECRNRAALEGVRLSSAVHAGSYRAAQLVYGNQVARSRSSTDDILVPAALSLSLFSVVDAIKFERHVRCKIVDLFDDSARLALASLNWYPNGFCSGSPPPLLLPLPLLFLML